MSSRFVRTLGYLSALVLFLPPAAFFLFLGSCTRPNNFLWHDPYWFVYDLIGVSLFAAMLWLLVRIKATGDRIPKGDVRKVGR